MKITVHNGTGVTAPQGFQASGIAAGLKQSDKPDMALIMSERPAAVAGAFTINRLAAAPVQHARELLQTQQEIRGVIINSGNANACTGPQGLADTYEMADCTAAGLGCGKDEVLVSSTGRIGVPLPMKTIRQGIHAAVEQLKTDGGPAAAEAIMTTDVSPKTCACRFEVAGTPVSLGGMAKGAGMIAPHMKTAGLHATMLAYFTTDAAVAPAFLTDCLNTALAASFNRITVDGDMSTNDTVMVLANGAAGNKLLTADHPDAETFRKALHAGAADLARKIVLDGEGATKFVEVQVTGARDTDSARRCADAIANSLLCKTAWFGGDPNWGRVLDAAGYANVALDTAGLALDYNGTPVVRQGMDAGTPEADLARVMQSNRLQIRLDLGVGAARATVWTCDLSYEYVKINAEYHT